MPPKTITTRFAPSPTGNLHIGSARTALFNYLFAKNQKGKFLLRIEDTDKIRSQNIYAQDIIKNLQWLQLHWDDKPTHQSQNAARHTEIAENLLKTGKAYKCFCSPERLAKMRETALAKGNPPRYDNKCRNAAPPKNPPPYAIRLKTPNTGETILNDRVMGQSTFPNSEMDDFIILRSDGTPTWMLALVVDDHDMNITHAIRGGDHHANAARQMHLYNALNWTPPIFAHIPLIHGTDGARLSKRHGATGLSEYQKDFLPEAMRNYLARLGWSHGDDEIFSTEEAIRWFSLEAIGRSPARFSSEKLLNLNAHYLRAANPNALLERIAPPLPKSQWQAIASAMPEMTKRSETLSEVKKNMAFLWEDSHLAPNDHARKILTPSARNRLSRLAFRLQKEHDWTAPALEKTLRDFADAEGVKLGETAQPLRAALTGRTVSIGVFTLLALLGKNETLERLQNSRE